MERINGKCDFIIYYDTLATSYRSYLVVVFRSNGEDSEETGDSNLKPLLRKSLLKKGHYCCKSWCILYFNFVTRIRSLYPIEGIILIVCLNRR